MSTRTQVPPEAVAAMLQTDLQQPREWDGPPELQLIYRHAFGYALVPMDVPEWVWASIGHPLPVLLGLTVMASAHPLKAVRLVQAAPPPGGGGLLVGLALRAEAWMGEDMSSEEAAQVDAGEVKIRDLPDRFEVRFTAAADVGGTRYLASLKRCEGEVRTVHTGKDGELGAAAGRVPEALAGLLESLVHAQGVAYS